MKEIGYYRKGKYKYIKYLCHCGNETEARSNDNKKSCGCHRRTNYTIGQKINNLTFLGNIEPVNNVRMGKYQCVCGKVNTTAISNIKKTKSCGCLREIKRGKEHFNYKGTTTLNKYIRMTPEYKEWRTNCFARDNYTCQISGQKGGELVVHHLEAFNIIINDLDLDNFTESELLFDINNGITISKELHILFHKIYGTTNFTKEDFNKFLIDKQNECKGVSTE